MTDAEQAYIDKAEKATLSFIIPEDMHKALRRHLVLKHPGDPIMWKSSPVIREALHGFLTSPKGKKPVR